MSYKGRLQEATRGEGGPSAHTLAHLLGRQRWSEVSVGFLKGDAPCSGRTRGVIRCRSKTEIGLKIRPARVEPFSFFLKYIME